MKNPICIVGSTLPVGFIINNLEALDIKKIIVLNQSLYESYSFLKYTHPNLKVLKTPDGVFKQSTYLFYHVILAKLNKFDVIFFHECGLPLLDLILLLLKPIGHFHPQASMVGWELATFDQMPKGKLSALIKLFSLEKYFDYYRYRLSGGLVGEFVYKFKKYSDNIITHNASFSIVKTIKTNLCAEFPIKKILFLTGKSAVPDDSQFDVYKNLLTLAKLNGCECAIKDHPFLNYRLNINLEGVQTINPLIPAELIVKDFDLVVGLASTALLGCSKSVSIIFLLEDMSLDKKLEYVSYLNNSSDENDVLYIKSIDQFTALLNGGPNE
jgi:hypothetical protein